MAAVTIHSDFGARENKVCQFPLCPHLFAMKWWDQMPYLSFLNAAPFLDTKSKPEQYKITTDQSFS